MNDFIIYLNLFVIYFAAMTVVVEPVHRDLLDQRYMGKFPSFPRFLACIIGTPLILLWEGFRVAANEIVPW